MSSDESSTSDATEAIACEDRFAQSQCLDATIPAPPGGLGVPECVWEPNVLEFPNGPSCAESTVAARCFALPPGGNQGCFEIPCASTSVLYRSNGDVLQVFAGDYCGVVPDGFHACGWDPTGDILMGPEQCDCACG